MTTGNDDDFRPLLDSYNRPPQFPADSLWEGVSGDEAIGRGRGRWNGVRLPAGLAAAAALVLFAAGAAFGSLVLGGGARSGVEPAGPERTTMSAAASIVRADGDARHVVWF